MRAIPQMYQINTSFRLPSLHLTVTDYRSPPPSERRAVSSAVTSQCENRRTDWRDSPWD